MIIEFESRPMPGIVVRGQVTISSSFDRDTRAVAEALARRKIEELGGEVVDIYDDASGTDGALRTGGYR